MTFLDRSQVPTPCTLCGYLPKRSYMLYPFGQQFTLCYCQLQYVKGHIFFLENPANSKENPATSLSLLVLLGFRSKIFLYFFCKNAV